MSFWEDLSPGIKIGVVVGVVALLYFIVARAVELPPFSCQDGAHCDGILCGECVVDEQQRGFNTEDAIGAPEGGGE
ncbi:MAG TPA: hypothetical protein RMH99_27060 [Sandaracinaceae bacterium LLY-WYZ-13_1]|nr:hypothetical protein [Sandaracinaceae bacterium LLY-WYZ-13_1]